SGSAGRAAKIAFAPCRRCRCGMLMTAAPGGPRSDQEASTMSQPAAPSAKIHIERMLYRNSIAVPGESAASYALLKVIPTGGPTRAPGLNLALVLDVSGSMYEEDGTGISRLQRIQDAATAALQRLRPDDLLSVVAFANNAQV